MNIAAGEITAGAKPDNKVTKCGASADGTWQRRGYSSLNGIVGAISIVTGKLLEIDVLSQFCRICKKISKLSKQLKPKQSCANHSGSACNMEVVGAYCIFERSERFYSLHYTYYYDDGDSKDCDAVKDVYGKNLVNKFECIGHMQKRVGAHLRKLRTATKGRGGKGKLTDNFIN